MYSLLSVRTLKYIPYAAHLHEQVEVKSGKKKFVMKIYFNINIFLNVFAKINYRTFHKKNNR